MGGGVEMCGRGGLKSRGGGGSNGACHAGGAALVAVQDVDTVPKVQAALTFVNLLPFEVFRAKAPTGCRHWAMLWGRLARMGKSESYQTPQHIFKMGGARSNRRAAYHKT